VSSAFPDSWSDLDDAEHENLNERIDAVRAIVHSLPQSNFDLLKRVSEHLDKSVLLRLLRIWILTWRYIRVTDFEEHNQMTSDSLAIVFSPNLLRAPQDDFTMIMANLGCANKLVKLLIGHVGLAIHHI
jgi:GTPase-activating protein BEM2